MITGDFTQVQDGVLDKTSPTRNVPKDRKAIHLLMKDLGLLDIWRLSNPREKENTFYSQNCADPSTVCRCLLGVLGIVDSLNFVLS